MEWCVSVFFFISESAILTYLFCTSSRVVLPWPGGWLVWWYDWKETFFKVESLSVVREWSFLQQGLLSSCWHPDPGCLQIAAEPVAMLRRLSRWKHVLTFGPEAVCLRPCAICPEWPDIQSGCLTKSARFLTKICASPNIYFIYRPAHYMWTHYAKSMILQDIFFLMLLFSGCVSLSMFMCLCFGSEL